MTWRERLDARIDRCPGCDWWRWDRVCTACTGTVDDELPAVVLDLHPDNTTTREVA